MIASAERMKTVTAPASNRLLAMAIGAQASNGHFQ